jgi:hypothetical protein
MTWLDAVMRIPCQVITRAPSATADEDGNPVPAETAHPAVCYVQADGVTEDADGRAWTTTWRVWLPAPAALIPGFDSFAALVIDGIPGRLEADAPPVLHYYPRGHRPHHIEVTVRQGSA